MFSLNLSVWYDTLEMGSSTGIETEGERLWTMNKRMNWVCL